MKATNSMPPDPAGSTDPSPPSVRQRAITACLAVVLVVAGALATVGWYEADKEVRILCGLLTTGVPGAEVSRILGTAEPARVRPADADVATASAFTFDAVANLRSSRCAVSLAEAAVTGSAFTRTVRLERVAAMMAASLLLLLSGFQVGLATGRGSGRMAWGGRFETLPRGYRRASAAAAALVLVMGWVLLERAEVVDLVEGDGAIHAAAWAITAFFLLSMAGNLASASRAERRLGIPVTIAMVVLGCVVAYSG